MILNKKTAALSEKGKNMTKKWYMIAIAIIFCIETIFSGLYACMTTFINDSNSTIMIRNRNDKISFFIKKNGRRRFGSPDKHAYFDVCVKQSQPESYRPLYVCKQNECGKNGNPQLKYSDLESNQGAAQLFTITKNENPHTSMVRELPMIQRIN